MAMSVRVIGFGPPSERWSQMKAVWDACMAAKVDVPAEVEAFFDDGPPDDHGQEVRVSSTDWTNGDMLVGLDVHVDKIPENVKVLRFYVAF